MGVVSRAAYLARILRVYTRRSSGPLSFWHERPELNERAFSDGADYFMSFAGKATYRGPFDPNGIPLLDYQGDIGRQYNPIAIAQYGLARFNRWTVGGQADDRHAWIAVADWLAHELRPNRHGVRVWMHDFDWPYREPLKKPWYSGLAQGNGLSMLVRAAVATGEHRYAEAADTAAEALMRDIAEGGVLATDDQGDLWIEEYLISGPPSHILNGFMWALWGIHDYSRWRGSAEAAEVWARCVRTLERRLGEFDTGWWSLYEAREGEKEMLASAYYHSLHIVQLRVMYRMTGSRIFQETADRFESYQRSRSNRTKAFVKKAIFKLGNY